MYITTSRRFKCVIQKWVKPLAFLSRGLSLFLWVMSSVATKVMPTSVWSNSFHFTCRKVLYFQEKHLTDFNEEGQ